MTVLKVVMANVYLLG